MYSVLAEVTKCNIRYNLYYLFHWPNHYSIFEQSLQPVGLFLDSNVEYTDHYNPIDRASEGQNRKQIAREMESTIPVHVVTTKVFSEIK